MWRKATAAKREDCKKTACSPNDSSQHGAVHQAFVCCRVTSIGGVAEDAGPFATWGCRSAVPKHYLDAQVPSATTKYLQGARRGQPADKTSASASVFRGRDAAASSFLQRMQTSIEATATPSQSPRASRDFRYLLLLRQGQSQADQQRSHIRLH